MRTPYYESGAIAPRRRHDAGHGHDHHAGCDLRNVRDDIADFHLPSDPGQIIVWSSLIPKLQELLGIELLAKRWRLHGHCHRGRRHERYAVSLGLLIVTSDLHLVTVGIAVIVRFRVSQPAAPASSIGW